MMAPSNTLRNLHLLVTEHCAAEQTDRSNKWQDMIPVKKSDSYFSPGNGRVTSQKHLGLILI